MIRSFFGKLGRSIVSFILNELWFVPLVILIGTIAIVSDANIAHAVGWSVWYSCLTIEALVMFAAIMAIVIRVFAAVDVKSAKRKTRGSCSLPFVIISSTVVFAIACVILYTCWDWMPSLDPILGDAFADKVASIGRPRGDTIMDTFRLMLCLLFILFTDLVGIAFFTLVVSVSMLAGTGVVLACHWPFRACVSQRHA